jgi:hypothetical protein
MTTAGRQVGIFTDNLKRLVGKDMVKRQVMQALGKEAVRLIVVRTRLGRTARRTTVKNELGEIKNRVVTLRQIKAHSATYREHRRQYQDFLSPMTRWNKQNLTYSGQLLASIGVRRVSERNVVIGADRKAHRDLLTGENEGFTNIDLAQWVTEQGRPFLELSSLDDKKLVRFYRRKFSDLLRRFGRINK